MAKHVYKAFFAGEFTATRKSHRDYTHAWRVVTHEGAVKVGFSGSRQLAEAQVAGWTNAKSREVVHAMKL